MKRKFIHTGLSLLAAVEPMFVALPAPAQEITGTPGSPSATTTISGEQLPAPPGKFGGGTPRRNTMPKSERSAAGSSSERPERSETLASQTAGENNSQKPGVPVAYREVK